MLVLTSDGEHVGTVALVDGKLVVKSKNPLAEKIIRTMKNFNGYPLSDEEAYKMMPHRLTGRVAASFGEGEEPISRDAYNAMTDSVATRKRVMPSPDESSPKERESR